MDQFEKNWHHDPQDRRVYMMLRLRDPIMDGIRRFGLHPPQEGTLPDTRDSRYMIFFTDTLTALSGDQTVDAHLYQDNNTWEGPLVCGGQ